MNDDRFEELVDRLVADGSIRVDIPAMTLEFILDEGGLACHQVEADEQPSVAAEPRLLGMAVLDALAFERARHDDKALRDWLWNAAWSLS